MPTYADLYNEKLLALGQSGPSNPVRLTISKGDYVWDQELSRFRYEEQWEEEDLMDHEELVDDNHLTTPLNGDAESRGTSPPPLTALQSTTIREKSEAYSHQPSLWVLDTNTLMSCLDLLNKRVGHQLPLLLSTLHIVEVAFERICKLAHAQRVDVVELCLGACIYVVRTKANTRLRLALQISAELDDLIIS